ncbi:MAG TPA: hypothetical protein VHX52_13430 [Steroidobacteraceae bacterium]|jgi:hypothetical protein|nr:hypothetical protein [Steroidobacteraceae bacterium]
MKTWEKWTTWASVIATAALGAWSEYTAHEALRLKQPLDKHTEMVRSYQGEIASAQSRKDLHAVTRLRVEYEKYEEQWRTVESVAEIVKPLTDLTASKLSPAATDRLTTLLGQLSAAPAVPNWEPTTMGAAYLALDKYDLAALEFSNATGGPKTLALKAAAYGGLATTTFDIQLRQQYTDTAVSSLRESISSSRGTGVERDVIRFAQETPTLSEYLPKTK